MDNVSRKQKGLPYRYDDPALLGDQHMYQDKMIEYNRTMPTETEKRQKNGRSRTDHADVHNRTYAGMGVRSGACLRTGRLPDKCFAGNRR